MKVVGTRLRVLMIVSRNLIVRQCKERKTGISEGGNPRMEQSISRFINDNHTR